MARNCTAKSTAGLQRLLGNNTDAVSAICSQYNVSAMGITDAVLSYTIQQLHNTEARLAAVNDDIAETRQSIDVQFVLQNSYMVFLMQAGFALYAAGVIRSKNTFNILMKGFVDVCVCGIVFYLFGYAFANGFGGNTNGFIGTSDFALSTFMFDWHKFIYQWSFCAAAATVVSGAVAERATFMAYLVYTVAISGLIYPVVVHWVTTEQGWLSVRHYEDPFLGVGAVDYAGAGYVHMVGGFASIVGAYLVGERIGRFDPGTDPAEFKGRSASTFVLGTFLLWFGWYGFNPGSYLSISSRMGAEVVSRTAVVTTLSACMAGVTSALLVWYQEKSWDLLATCSGALAGLVASTSCCSVVEPWVGLVIGFGASYVFIYADRWVCFFKIDDPVSAFAMHGCCGVYSLIVTGLFAQEKFLHQVYPNYPKGKAYQGVFMGGSGSLLACQFTEIVCVAAWVLSWAFAIFYTLKRLNLLRIDTIEEVVGLDVYTHGEVMGDGMVNPNATKFHGGPAHYNAPAATPLYPPTPATGETPVTLRMDSRGNMRWTPRQGQSLDQNIVSGTAFGGTLMGTNSTNAQHMGGEGDHHSGPVFRSNPAYPFPNSRQPMDIDMAPARDTTAMGHPHVQSFK